GKKGTVVLVNTPANEKKPEYTTHYTLETFQDGFFKTLDYEGSPLVQTFPCSLDIPAGACLMVTGNRHTNGSVLAKLKVFEVKAGETTTQTVDLRKKKLTSLEYGRLNPALFTEPIGPGGMVIAWIDPDKEPTKHLLADLRQKKSEFEKWKGNFVLVFPTETQMKTFVKTDGALMAKTISYSFQTTFPVKLSDLKLKTGELKNLPVVILLNTYGEINFLSEGYRIGIGDELLGMRK
ncbi:MAG: hypothetical protein WCK09_18395, partial [Bacteroidota bacterium]